MTFDPNRCGSFSASADTCGSATRSKSIYPEPATSAGNTSAGHIIPAYVKSEPAALVGFVRQHMSFLRATSLNRMIKRSKSHRTSSSAGSIQKFWTSNTARTSVDQMTFSPKVKAKGRSRLRSVAK
jgi:hypothetical protein